MKKIIYPIFFLVAIFAASCAKDLGNYTYSEVNEVNVISGILPEYVRSVRDTISISPVLEFTKDPNPDLDNYSFEWMDVIGMTAGTSRLRRFADTKDLVDFRLPSNMTSNNPNRWVPPGQTVNNAIHTILYRITDKRTGVRSSHIFNIRILPAGGTGDIARGVLVLCEVEGESRLDMLCWNNPNSTKPDLLFTYRPDILSYMNSALPDEQLTCPPKQIITYAEGKLVWIWLLTENGTNRLNTNNLSWTITNEITRNAVFFPANWRADKMVGINTGNYIYMMGQDDEGDFGIFSTYSNTIAWTYTKPINRLDSESGQKFEPSPIVLLPTSSLAVLYNEETKGFVRSSPQSNIYCTKPTTAETLFPWSDPDRELLYMGAGATTAFYAVVSYRSSGKVEYLAFNNLFEQTDRVDISNLEGIKDAASYSMHTSKGAFLYYLNKDRDKIYRLRFTDNQRAEKVYEAPAGYKVSLMGFGPTNNAKNFNAISSLATTVPTDYEAYLFYIFTYDPTGKDGENGVMEAYVSDVTNGGLKLYEHKPVGTELIQKFRFENIGKVVSMDYKTL